MSLHTPTLHASLPSNSCQKLPSRGRMGSGGFSPKPSQPLLVPRRCVWLESAKEEVCMALECQSTGCWLSEEAPAHPIRRTPSGSKCTPWLHLEQRTNTNTPHCNTGSFSHEQHGRQAGGHTSCASTSSTAAVPWGHTEVDTRMTGAQVMCRPGGCNPISSSAASPDSCGGGGGTSHHGVGWRHIMAWGGGGVAHLQQQHSGAGCRTATNPCMPFTRMHPTDACIEQQDSTQGAALHATPKVKQAPTRFPSCGQAPKTVPCTLRTGSW